MSYKHQKGVIKESAVKALLKDPLFRQRVERNLKGKGSYQRNQKHRNREAAYESGVTYPFLYAA